LLLLNSVFTAYPANALKVVALRRISGCCSSGHHGYQVSLCLSQVADQGGGEGERDRTHTSLF